MRVLCAIGVTAIVSLAIGCGGNTRNNVTVTHVDSHPLSDVVTLHQDGTCEAVNQGFCLGEFGLTVDLQGNFTAGPSPSGKVVTGSITADELAALRATLAPVVQSDRLACQPNNPVIPGTGSNAMVSFTDGSTATTFSSGGIQSCFRGGQAVAQPFEDEFEKLLAKYYPIPFPS